MTASGDRCNFIFVPVYLGIWHGHFTTHKSQVRLAAEWSPEGPSGRVSGATFWTPGWHTHHSIHTVSRARLGLHLALSGSMWHSC